MGNEWRESYNGRWKIYDIFSKREDYPDAAWKAVKKRVDFQKKVVFEMGCGTGKYTRKIATLAKHLFANDISEVMIEKAKDACHDLSNITYICDSAHKSGLPDNSIDIIFSAWGYVAGDIELAQKVENEFCRILKPGGEVWILDNYYEGQFTQLRGKKVIEDGNKYSEEKYGYKLVEIIPTYFLFESVEEAAEIFGFLFGNRTKETIIQNDIMKITDTVALMRKCYDERNDY